jgi:hypothetical protein
MMRTNRKANMVETSIGNGNEVRFSDPRVPMVSERRLCGGSALVLPKGILVDDAGVASFLKESWCDPWLQGY